MAWLCIPVLLSSCATYNSKMQSYYSYVQQGNYTKALKSLEGNKFIKRGRNELLYYMEMGKLYHLKNDFIISNRYFNLADNFMEGAGKSMGDIALGNLLNPMQQTYTGEDFERFMVHYYKALNYAALGLNEDAVVEARRITLSTNTQGDKFTDKPNRYSKDAFALNLQGIIYESAGDINNAFIAYRNAADVYLEAGGNYYGVTMPQQLKQDVLRTAAAMGFTGEVTRYEKLLGTSLQNNNDNAGELVLFIEEGNAPVKKETNLLLTTGSNGANFMYVDETGNNMNLPFNYSTYNLKSSKITDLRALRVAIPKYEVQYNNNAAAAVTINGISYTTSLAQNVNNVAVNILKERTLTELSNALARQLTKKLVEKGVQAGTEAIAKSDDKKNSNNTDKDKKNKDKAEAAGQVAGLLVNIINAATEKADTRNWQSLPAFINYVRLPLKPGENELTITINGKTQTLKVVANNRLQILNYIPQ